MSNKQSLVAVLVRALRYIDYAAGGDGTRDDPSKIVEHGLTELIKQGVDIEELAKDSQFDREHLQRLKDRFGHLRPPDSDRIRNLESVLTQAVEDSGFRVSGPTDSRAAEDGEPKWVCQARAALADGFRAISAERAIYEAAARRVQEPETRARFDRWRSQKRQVPCLSTGLQDPGSFEPNTPGWIYPGRYYIEIRDEAYHLHIERSEWDSVELEKLEVILFDYAFDEGVCDTGETEG